MVTTNENTQNTAPTPGTIQGKYGQLNTDEPEHLLIETVRDYLAIYRPHKFLPNWDQMSQEDQVACLTACVNSQLYMRENVISLPETRVLLSVLKCLTQRTDSEPEDPTGLLEDFGRQADRNVPEWNSLPVSLRLRFTDFYHHSESFEEKGKLSWLDVEVMLTFAMRQGHFLTPASFEKLQFHQN